MNAPVLELFPFAMPRNPWARIARERSIYRFILRHLAPGHPPTIRRLSDLERRLHAKTLRAEAPRARRAGDHERALRIYLQLVALEPHDGFHPLRAGDCLVRTGRRDEAIDCYREAAIRFEASGHEGRARAVTRILERLDAAAVPLRAEASGVRREAAAGAVAGRIARAGRRAAV